MVRGKGLEPLGKAGFEPAAFASFAIRAMCSVVPRAELESAWPRGRQALNLLRLPVSPPGQVMVLPGGVEPPTPAPSTQRSTS